LQSLNVLVFHVLYIALVEGAGGQALLIFLTDRLRNILVLVCVLLVGNQMEGVWLAATHLASPST